MTEKEILDTLDNSNDGFYCHFTWLEDAYSYLIDTRLNVFRSENKEWVIAIERLGYNPRYGRISLGINYYGNCLTNLEYYNNRPTNTQDVLPIDDTQFFSTLYGESLIPDAKFWLVRGQQIELSHDRQDYLDAAIILKESEPNEIRAEEAERLVILKYRELFRATDEELYKSIPKNLKKILVLDEWYHKDYYKYYEDQQMDRPSSYETWQQIAKVIVTNDISNYNPSLKPNTHWSNWPESGGL